MHRASSSRSVVTASQKVFLAILFLSLVLAGCGNECVFDRLQPRRQRRNSSGWGNCCPVGPTTGNVRLRLASSFASTSGDAAPARIQHIFVTLRGIEANPSANADEGSPDWQELAPKLATHLAQVDLLAPGGDSCEAETFEDAAVPADAYHQIRLRLAPNLPELPGESVLEENSCGTAGLNCMVTSDGSVRPLVLDSKASQIQILPEQIADGFFRILPDTSIGLQSIQSPVVDVHALGGRHAAGSLLHRHRAASVRHRGQHESVARRDSSGCAFCETRPALHSDSSFG